MIIKKDNKEETVHKTFSLAKTLLSHLKAMKIKASTTSNLHSRKGVLN